MEHLRGSGSQATHTSDGEAAKHTELLAGLPLPALPLDVFACAGRISLAVVAVYIRAMGGWIAFAFLATGLISTEVARVAGTVWLSVWTNSTNAEGKAPHGPFYYLGVYAGISGIQVRPHFVSVAIHSSSTTGVPHW